ncbi:6707_t:CDS:2, partial [Racocetra fulgida]
MNVKGKVQISLEAPGERILYNDRRNNSDIRREGIGRQLGPNLRDHEVSSCKFLNHNFDDWDLRTIPRSRERKRPEHDRPRSDRDRERNDRDRNASISRERQLSRVVPSRECTNQYLIHNMSGFEYPELETRQKFSFGFNKDFERDELQGIGPTYGNWRNRNRSTSPSPRSSVTSSSSFTRHRTRSPVPNKLDITKSEEPTNLSPTNIHSRSRPPSIKSAASPHRFEIEQSSVFMRLQNRDEKSSIDDNSSSCREKMQYTPEYKDEETNFSIESIQEIENSSQSNIGNEKGGWTGWHSLERREVEQSQRMEESKLIKEQELLQSCSQNNDTSLEESDAQIEKFRNNITDSDGEPTLNHIESNNVVISSTTAICDIVQNSTNENTNVGIHTRIIEAPGLDGVPISQHIKTEELSNSGEERPKFQSLFEELEY